jgi:hypothetical protein
LSLYLGLNIFFKFVTFIIFYLVNVVILLLVKIFLQLS